MLKFYRIVVVFVLLVAMWPLAPAPATHAQSGLAFTGIASGNFVHTDGTTFQVYRTGGFWTDYFTYYHDLGYTVSGTGLAGGPELHFTARCAPSPHFGDYTWAGCLHAFVRYVRADSTYVDGPWSGGFTTTDTEYTFLIPAVDFVRIEIYARADDDLMIFSNVNITGLPTPTPTVTPTPSGPIDYPQPGIPNFLENGNFELPLDGNWELGADITIPAFPQDIVISAGPGRVDENYSGFSGDPYCGNFYGLIRSTGISQRFDWPGGTMYIQYRVRRKLADGERSYPQIEFGIVAGAYTVLTTPLFDGKSGEFIDREAGEDGWQLNQHTISVPPGTYEFIAYNVDYEGNQQVGTFSTGTPTAPTGPDGFLYEARSSHDYEIDDVTVSANNYISLCSGAGGPTITPIPSTTPTPTRTRTPGPSPTRTNTRTPGPSPTPTNAGTAFPPSNYSNCNFENGSAAWAGSNFSIKLAGGPVGPQYAEVRAPGTMHQNFTWSVTGNAYLTFWIGPGSYGEVAIRNTSTNISSAVWVGTNETTGWQMRSAVRGNLQAGSYRLEVRPYGAGFISIDGVQIARNTYAFCGSNNGNPITPTNGPTAYVSPTITRTPSPGPTPTQKPPTNTFTPGPTRTPFPTWTPQPTGTPTFPATATNTPANDSTATAQAATATAQASITPTPTPNATSTPPPQQPEPQPYADCIRPTNPVDLAGWGEYGTCVALTWFVWTPDNTQQVLDLREALDGYEPFGTMAEVTDTFELLNDFLNSINWENTGITCTNGGVKTDWIVADAYGLLNGDFEIAEGPEISTNCQLNGADLIMGTNISAGICFTTNLLCYYGLMQWVYVFMNMLLITLGFLYIQSKWINKATQS